MMIIIIIIIVIIIIKNSSQVGVVYKLCLVITACATFPKSLLPLPKRTRQNPRRYFILGSRSHNSQDDKPDFWDTAKNARKMTVRMVTLKNVCSIAVNRRTSDEHLTPKHSQTGHSVAQNVKSLRYKAKGRELGIIH